MRNKSELISKQIIREPLGQSSRVAHAYNPTTPEMGAVYEDDDDDIRDRRTVRNSRHGKSKKQTGVNWIIRGVHNDAEPRTALKTARFRHKRKI